MATAQLPKVQEDDSMNNLVNLFKGINDLVGGATTTSKTSSSADPGASAQADELLQKIMGDSNSGDIDLMVQNILERAKQTFGPANINSNAAGLRGYSDSVHKQLQNEAMARATAEAASAKLGAINAANKTAAELVDAKLRTTKTSVQTQRTGASTTGKALGALSVGSAGYSLAKKTGMISQKDKYPRDEFDPDQMADADIDSFFDSQSFSAPVASTQGGVGTAEAAAAASNFSVSDTSQLQDIMPPAIFDAEGLDAAYSSAALNSETSGIQNPNGTPAAVGEAAINPVMTPSGFPMPAARMVDPETGLPLFPMPPAKNFMPPAVPDAGIYDETEAVDVLPADEGETLANTFTAEETSGAAGAGAESFGAEGTGLVDAVPGLFFIDAVSGGDISAATMNLTSDFVSNTEDVEGAIGEAAQVIPDTISSFFDSISDWF